VFSTPAQAADAIHKLHAHVYKGSLLSVALKKRMDNLAKPTILREGQKIPATPAPSHASRLIVRNIPFNATELDIRATFLPYGPIHSIHIPMDVQGPNSKSEAQPENDATAVVRKPRTKGFAFVWMLSKKDAEKAIEGCNGTVLRAGIAQSMVSDKQKKKKERRLEAKGLKGATAKKEEGGGDDAGEDEEGNKSTDRIIAVDWALSKDRWEEERAKMEDVKMCDSSESDTSEDSDGCSETDATNEHLGMHDGESEENDSDSNKEGEEDEEERVKPQLPPPDTGTTVFIRNVSFDATEEELRTL